MRRVSGPAKGLVVGVTVLAAALAGCSGQRPLNRVLEAGDRAMEARQYEAALAEYREYVDRDPSAVDVRAKLARTMLETGDTARAREQATIAFNVRPLNEEYADLLAEAMYAADEREALVDFLQRQVAERGRVSDYIRLGRFSKRLGNADEALVAFNTAARVDAGRTVAPHLALAEFYEQIGDQRQQVQRLRMALFIEPDNLRIQEQLRALGEVVGPSLPLRPTELP
jgi:tetratricopeptide (TPR) repeat protein